MSGREPDPVIIATVFHLRPSFTLSWLYHRFTLSFRDIEDLLAECGILVYYESPRRWCLKFGPTYARSLRWKHKCVHSSHLGKLNGLCQYTVQFRARSELVDTISNLFIINSSKTGFLPVERGDLGLLKKDEFSTRVPQNCSTDINLTEPS